MDVSRDTPAGNGRRRTPGDRLIPRRFNRIFEPPLKITGDAARYNHREGNDDYSQPRALFSLFDKGEKTRLFSNIAESMQGVPEFIIQRQLGYFEKVHPDYAAGVRAVLAEQAKKTK